MEILKAVLFKIGHMFLSTFGIFRRALCCFRRRRRLSDFALPMTKNDLALPLNQGSFKEELQNWGSWNDTDQPLDVAIVIDETRKASRRNSNDRQSLSKDEEDNEDFFKEMAPAIKKPKMLLVKGKRNENNTSQVSNGRFAMDLKASLSHVGAELGTIDDSVVSWEEEAASEELRDTDLALKEHRLVEREKRLAEHQRKKFEKELQRLGKNDNVVPIAMRLS